MQPPDTEVSLLLTTGFSFSRLPRVVLEPYDFLFDTAVEAYYNGDWMSVILNMEKALRNKATVRRVKTQCRLSCANQSTFGEPLAGLGVPIPGAGAVEDLGFFQRILKRADCVNSCESEKLGPPTFHQVSEEVEMEFRKRTPYNYLQVAYFKIDKLDKAVAAANTFFLANPDHTEMRQNLDYYRMMAGVQEDDFKDLEARLHMAEFLLAKRYYSDDSFGLAAEHFEVAVDEYFTADKECRALCEGAYNYDGYNYMEYSADLFQTITDHYMQVLNCKQRCSVELASTATNKPFEDFLPAHFNYLQFSYYNSEKYEKAIECAKTFLLFHPEDEVMNQNLAYYSVVLGEDKAETISARQVVKQYIQQSLLEKELLYYGYEIFGITFVDPDTWTPADVMPQKLREKQKADRETAARITEEIGNLMKEIETLVEEKNKDSSDLKKIPPSLPPSGPVLYDDIKVTMSSAQLNGSQRVLLDGVISDDECGELHRLSNVSSLTDSRRSSLPYCLARSEVCRRVPQLGQEGKVPLKSARLFFDLSEKVRKVLESYFRLDAPLYFSYSHLVCRSAIDGKSASYSADTLLLNECIKEPPAYTHRDYSAILYLNDDFEGGDFIFTELDAKTVTAELRPQCGRVVGFGSGQENPHGVRAVTKGQRCAVALWFTLDPAHEEKVLYISSTINSADKPAQEKLDGPSGTQADKPAETPKDKAEAKADSKTTKTTKAKTAPKTKAKAGDQAKAKTADKVKAKPAAKTDGKQTVKTKPKQTDEKGAKPAVKKTAKAAAKKDPKAVDSQKDKDEL
uniref:procollagen-proline 3-dioxygenase n=1 Tax=Myripristis murdjan TaxID=586833 RepID=A0A668AJF7_9TELE